MFVLLIIGDDVKRVTQQVEAPNLLGRSPEVAVGTVAPWDVIVAGDYLDAIEDAARRDLDGSNGRLWREAVIVFGGVRGNGLPALVQQLALAANRAAAFRKDARVAFVFRDASLAPYVESRLGSQSRLVDTRQRDGLVAVLTNPGLDKRWPSN